MENLKIHVKNEAESKEAQELFFKLGYGWFEERKHEFNGLDARYLLTKSHGTLHYTKEYTFFALLEIKETTLQELRDKVVLKRNDVSDATHTDQDGWKWYIGADSYVWQAGNAQQLKQWDKSELKHVDLKPIQESTMNTPQHKEYLDPQNNYELIEWDGGFMIQEHWIEVPPNAEVMTMPNAYFWKRGLENYAWNGKEWNNNKGQDLHSYMENSYSAKIVWLRNAGKEYLDPTDNYKLIKTPSPMSHWVEVPMGAESYMMTSAHAQRGIFYKKGWYEFLEAYERNNWKQTGYSNKNYKSEMLEKGCALVWQRDTNPNAMNADADSEVHSSADELFASISLESTLAERQASYGDFRDVANTTGQLMGVLRNSKNGHTLPYMHEEALHMICSKMARLVNGDCNHKDSWHDIAGYAKLVEDSL